MTAVVDGGVTVDDLARLMESDVKGATTPRLWTRPLSRPGTPGRCGCGCNLTEQTTLGFKVIRFAEELAGQELYPWQRWWLIHALELLDDGTFRFKTIITLVSRQNGKTFLLKILALFFLYMKDRQLVVGAAQALDIAKESWLGAVQMAQGDEELAAEIAPNGIRLANGEQCLTLENGSRYRITAATPGAARGLSVDLLILDELRMQRDWLAWGALTKTTTARPNSLTVGISNAGDDRSEVLNTVRERALSGADPRTGLFEWSAPSDCDIDDVEAWRMANPALGYTISLSTLRSFRQMEPANVFKTENLCIRVDTLDCAIDPSGWKAGAREGHVIPPGLRPRLCYCLDVAPDGQHVTLAGAALSDTGQVHVQVFGAWGSTDDARAALGELFAALRPRVLGWFPTGPGSVFAVDLATYQGDLLGQLTVNRKEYLDWAPGAVELTGNTVPTLCQSFADVVQGHQVIHPNDPLLNAHVNGSQRKDAGDGWRFVRRGAGHVDAAYAAAGAVQLARTLPLPRKRVRHRVF